MIVFRAMALKRGEFGADFDSWYVVGGSRVSNHKARLTAIHEGAYTKRTAQQRARTLMRGFCTTHDDCAEVYALGRACFLASSERSAPPSSENKTKGTE